MQSQHARGFFAPASALLCCGLALLLPGRYAAVQAAGPAEPDAAVDAVIVSFHEKSPLSARLQAVGQRRLQIDRKRQHPAFARLRISPEERRRGVDVKQVLASLRRDPTVRYAEPDFKVRASAVPNDASFGQLWGLHNTGQSGGTSGADIDAPQAWDTTTGSPSIIVAVVDTGVDYTHPDLASNIYRRDGAVVGYDFDRGDADPMDDNEHGTHVAGTIAASGNDGRGVIGVAPNVKIMPLKFLDAEGSGYISDGISCIDFAVQNGARVINASWGGGGRSQALADAIRRARDAGVLFVTAAGNEGDNNDQVESFPGNHNSEFDNVISVAATDDGDRLSWFSNFGAARVDIAAPGEGILSTLPNGAYGSLSGTSMATPHVAGAAALVLSHEPSMTPSQVRTRLLAAADRVATLQGKVRSGRLNASKALGTPAVVTTFSVSGRVLLNGAGLAGVTLAAGGVSTATAADGSYRIEGLPAGTYTLTPTRSGHQFSPSSRAITVGADQSGLDFTASVVTTGFSIRLTPSTVWAGDTVQAEVVLASPAKANVSVNLTSSNTRIAPVTRRLTVRRGATSTRFTIRTRWVRSDTQVRITATQAGSTTQAILNLWTW